ncbi:MAG TPA: DnaJ domain-containing protein, partial [Cytophagales bacterium]|nr:DnaJ domain-containing protein [Cytophagales bacterium]
MRLSSNATADEIKRSYRRLAMVYHPDRSNHPEAHELFSEINEAYEILSDQTLRNRYDNLINSQGDLFVEAHTFSENINTNRNHRRTQRVYRATRKTKDIITPYIVKMYKMAAYISVVLMSLLLIDFVMPNVKYEQILLEKKFGEGST